MSTENPPSTPLSPPSPQVTGGKQGGQARGGKKADSSRANLVHARAVKDLRRRGLLPPK